MATKQKNTNAPVSAIDAIRQPFSFESKSTQIESPAHDVRLGGTTTTVSVFNQKTGNYESKTRIEGGEVIKASYRIRKGKTHRERIRAGKNKISAPVVSSTKGNKKK